jgi:hypothetical protein
MRLLSETRMSLTTLAHREGVSPSTVWRWASRGVRGVRLESALVGGRRMTSAEAFARFAEATTATAAGGSPPQRTNREQSAAIRRAEEALRRAGV